MAHQPQFTPNYRPLNNPSDPRPKCAAKRDFTGWSLTATTVQEQAEALCRVWQIFRGIIPAFALSSDWCILVKPRSARESEFFDLRIELESGPESINDREWVSVNFVDE